MSIVLTCSLLYPGRAEPNTMGSLSEAAANLYMMSASNRSKRLRLQADKIALANFSFVEHSCINSRDRRKYLSGSNDKYVSALPELMRELLKAVVQNHS